MSTQQKVDFESMATLSRFLKERTEAIEAILETLDATVGPLKAQWTGAASEAYQQAQKDWTAELLVMTSVLGKASGAVSSARNTYSSLEYGFVKQL